MPTPTYDLIASVVLSSNAATFQFTSIPATYRDLIIVLNGTDTTTNTQGVFITINGDTGANYSNVYARNTTSATATKAYINTTDTSLRSSAIVQIMDYSATDKHKTILSRGNAPSTWVWMSASRWASTSAVTSITFDNDLGDFASGYTAYLYGIAS